MYDLQPNMDSDLTDACLNACCFSVAMHYTWKEDLVVPVISTTIVVRT
jgi:hypothetical protein